MKRCFLILASVVALGCVDTWEPNGPVDTPPQPEDPGDFTSSVVADPNADGAASANTSTRRRR